MASLRDFIASRREEVKRQLAELKAELRELNLAEAAIKVGVPDGGSPNPTSDRGKLTIKEMVTSVLRSRAEGAEATEIVALIAGQFGDDVPRSSLSPQLSRLKDEGILSLDGRIWRLAEEQEGQVNTTRPSSEYGGGEVRGEASSTDSPEGANPSTSILDHPGSGKTKDELWS